MNRRTSDRVKTVVGAGLLMGAFGNLVGFIAGVQSTNSTDIIFCAFGALFGVLANMEESSESAAQKAAQ